MTTACREFWSQDANGYDLLVAITYTSDEAMVVWDSLRRARTLVIERQHESDRYKGRFLRGWSEDDGFFHASSLDEDPGSKHRHLATVTLIDGGICRCDECGEHMLEDERHWHPAVKPSSPPADASNRR